MARAISFDQWRLAVIEHIGPMLDDLRPELRGAGLQDADGAWVVRTCLDLAWLASGECQLAEAELWVRLAREKLNLMLAAANESHTKAARRREAGAPTILHAAGAHLASHTSSSRL